MGSNTLLHVAAACGGAESDSNMGPDFWAGRMAAQSIPALLSHGLLVDARDGEGRTPFQRAVTALNWKAMTLLWTNGANVNAADAQGNSALHQLAAQRWDLAQHMKDPASWNGPGASAAIARAGQGGQVFVDMYTNSSVTAWLLEHGANPNLTNHQARTPLELLCEPHPWRFYTPQEVTNRVALLVKAGAKATILSKQGEAVLQQVTGEGKPADTIR
jgi:ankyrin repeat protein